MLLILPLIFGMAFLVLPICLLATRAVSELGMPGIAEILADDLFRATIARTLMLAVAVSAVCCVLGVLYALALMIAPKTISIALMAVLLGSFWLSLLVRTFGWVLLFQPNGALDQFLQRIGLTTQSLDLLQTTGAMYPAMIHVMLPYLVLPVYAAGLRLNGELLRAGQSLGAGPVSIVWHVIIPHLRQSVLAGAIMIFMLSLAFYVTPLLVGGPANLTIATLIGREFSELYNIENAAAMSVLLLVFVLAIFVIADRFVSLIPGKSSR